MRRLAAAACFSIVAAVTACAATEAPNEAEAPLPPAQAETRAVVKEAQQAERLIAAAEDVRDFTELRAQSYVLVRLLGRFPDKEDSGYKGTCLLAIDRLGNLARYLTIPSRARAVVDAATNRSEYLKLMPQCEALLKLPSPGRPNLR